MAHRSGAGREGPSNDMTTPTPEDAMGRTVLVEIEDLDGMFTAVAVGRDGPVPPAYWATGATPEEAAEAATKLVRDAGRDGFPADVQVWAGRVGPFTDTAPGEVVPPPEAFDQGAGRRDPKDWSPDGDRRR